METPIHFDQKDKVTKAASAGRPKAASSTRQHKFIDYNRALDATQLYLNEIGFSPPDPEEEVHFARLAQKGDPAGASA